MKNKIAPRYARLSSTSLIFCILLGLGSNAWSCTPALLDGTNDLDSIQQSQGPDNRDINLSGTVYLTEDFALTNDGDATLTIEPGTQLIACGEYVLRLGQHSDAIGGIIAKGTAAEPITMESFDPAQHWDGVTLWEGINPLSIMQHVIIRNAGFGGDDFTPGALYIYRSGNSNYAPVIDHVTIENSAAHGIYVWTRRNAAPSALSNLTITGSALAPVHMSASAMSGLGKGNLFTGNGIQTIQIIGDSVYFSQIIRKQPLPYEVLDTITMRADDSILTNTELEIEPGVTLLMHPGKFLHIGSLYGDSRLLALGTEAEPITITRLNGTADNWGGIQFGNWYTFTHSKMNHVNISHAQTGIKQGMTDRGSVSLDNVSILDGDIGFELWSGKATVRNSQISNNRLGFKIYSRTQLVIRSSELTNNSEQAILVYHPNDTCVDAMGNYWGTADGPLDTDSAPGLCGWGGTNSGTGDSVTAAVSYNPWLTTPKGIADFTSITPTPYWVMSNGVAEAIVSVTLTDESGQAAVGKTLRLNATIGTVTPAEVVTDNKGEALFHISSDVAGPAELSAYNITDNLPLGAISSINFWEGANELSGLVDANGPPYASPELFVSGRPMEIGVPATFKLPMTNSRSLPLDVTVKYGISGLNIGDRFTTVNEVSSVLEPGDSWDADGFWVPDVTGHHCIQAQIDVTELGGSVARSTVPMSVMRDNTSGTRQINDDANPCGTAINNINKAIPLGKPGGMLPVYGHFLKMAWLAGNANRCLKEQLSFGKAPEPRVVRNTPSYTQLIQPVDYTPPTIVADGVISQAQADLWNQTFNHSSRIFALVDALSGTSVQMSSAASANEQTAMQLQFTHYRSMLEEYKVNLEALQKSVNDLRGQMIADGIEDIILEPSAYDEAKQALEPDFDQETLDFLRSTGLSSESIAELRQQLLGKFLITNPQTTSFYAQMVALENYLTTMAAETRQQLNPVPIAAFGGGRAVTEASHAYLPQPIVYKFKVANPTAAKGTVELKVRPVNLPLDWLYRLDQTSLILEPAPDEGSSADVQLTLTPGKRGAVENSEVILSVEGYMDDQLIGGVQFRYLMPHQYCNGTQVTITESFPAGDFICVGTTSITTSEHQDPVISIGKDTSVEFHSPITTLQPGFKVVNGGVLKVTQLE